MIALLPRLTSGFIPSLMTAANAGHNSWKRTHRAANRADAVDDAVENVVGVAPGGEDTDPGVPEEAVVVGVGAVSW